jgi:hypothetical protein
MMGAREQPGAQPEHHDAAAKDEEPSPPVRVRVLNGPWDMRRVVVIPAILATVRNISHTDSMQPVTVAARPTRRVSGPGSDGQGETSVG